MVGNDLLPVGGLGPEPSLGGYNKGEITEKPMGNSEKGCAQISIKPLNAGTEPPITPPFTPRPFAGLIHPTPWIGGEPGIKGGIDKMGEKCKHG